MVVLWDLCKNGLCNKKGKKRGQHTLLVSSIDPFYDSAQWPFCLFLAPQFLCFLLFNGISIVLRSCASNFRKLTSLLLIQVRSCSCIPLPSTSMTGFCLYCFIRPFSHSTSLCPPFYLGIIYLFLFCSSHA